MSAKPRSGPPSVSRGGLRKNLDPFTGPSPLPLPEVYEPQALPPPIGDRHANGYQIDTEIIVAETSKEVEEITNKTVEEVREEAKKGNHYDFRWGDRTSDSRRKG